MHNLNNHTWQPITGIMSHFIMEGFFSPWRWRNLICVLEKRVHSVSYVPWNLLLCTSWQESFGALIWFCPCMLYVSDQKYAHKWGQDPHSQAFGKCCLLAYLHFCKSCLKIQIYQFRQVSNFSNLKSKKSRSMKSQGSGTLAVPSLVTVSYKMNGSIFRVTHSVQWPLAAPGLSSPKDKST